jgi:hypothetical protein
MTRQHVVSQVVLRRFADESNLLSVFDRISGRVTRKGAGGIAFVDNLVAHEPEASELLWKAVEDHVPELFSALESRSLLDEPSLVDLAKDLIALHWGRSHTLLAIWNELIPEKLQLLVDRLLTRFTPEEAFLSVTGLYPPSTQVAKAYVEEFIARTWGDQFIDGSLFRERLEFNYEKARSLAASSSLQVAEALTSAFLIGDNPALSVQRDSTSVGPLQGVSWDLADTILMPVDPKYCIGLGPEPKWIECNSTEVMKTNRPQLAGFVRHLVFPPGWQCPQVS